MKKERSPTRYSGGKYSKIRATEVYISLGLEPLLDFHAW